MIAAIILLILTLTKMHPKAIDGDEIQGMLNSARDGDLVMIPDGILTLNNPLSISAKGVTLKGSGDTIIRIEKGAKISAIRATDCQNLVIADLKIDGGGHDNIVKFGERTPHGRYVENFGLVLINIDDLKLERLEIRNTFLTGVFMRRCKNVRIKNITVEDAFGELDNSKSNPNRNENLVPWLYSDGLGIDSSENVTVKGSTFSRNANGGVAFFTGCQDISIYNCSILDNGWSGISLDGSNGANTEVLIEGCIITGSLRSGICAYMDENCTFRDNTIQENGWAGIFVQAGGGHKISGNIITDNGRHDKGEAFWGKYKKMFPQRKHNIVEPGPCLPYSGILLAETSGLPTKYNEITGNTINAAATQEYAVYFLTGFTEHNLFSNNTVMAEREGDFTYGQPSSSDIVADNTLRIIEG